MTAVHTILCTITLALLTLGIYDYVTNFEENGCSMTYMFRRPQYLPVSSLQSSVQGQFPRYALYYYTEGRNVPKFSDFKLSGIPVLFIPGNGGSYKQVRSMGSVALTKSERSDYHFDYFSVDLNEEKNALYGGFLFEQTEYVHQCIRHILTLYSKAPNVPKSVVVIGHSMGGLIARALYSIPDFDPSLVHTIITQATPHHPVLRVDHLLDNYYWHVNRYWQENQDSLDHVTFLSVGGGHQDVQVKSASTGLEGIVAPHRHVSTVSMSVPHVWLAADHQCIVWCKELVLATERALFDMIDPKTKLINKDPDERMKVFRFHFSNHSGGKNYQKQKEDVINFADKKDIIFKVAKNSKLHIPTSNNDKLAYHLFPIPTSNHSFVATTKISSARWVFLCTKGTDTTCEEGLDVTARGRVAPPLKAGMREIRLSPEELAGYQFVVVRVPSGSVGVINAEMYNWDERHRLMELPPFFSMVAVAENSLDRVDKFCYLVRVLPLPVGAGQVRPGRRNADQYQVTERLFRPALILLYKLEPKTVANISDTSYISFTVDGFTSMSTAYVAELVPVSCHTSVKKKINSTLRFEVPWKQEDTFSVTSAESTNTLSLKLQSGRPPHDNESLPRLSVYMDPRCQYTLTLSYSHKEGYGQIVRFYGQTVPTILSIIVVLAVSFQLKHLYADKPLERVSRLHDLYCKPYIVVPPIALFRALVKHEGLEQSYDFYILSNQGIFFAFLPLVMFLLSYGLCAVILIAIEMAPEILGRLWAWVNAGEISTAMFDSPRSQPYRVWPFATVGALMALAIGTCGSNALILLCVLTEFKAASLKARVVVAEPEEEPEEDSHENSKVKKKMEKIHRKANNSYQFVSTVLILLVFLLVFALPTSVAWIENLRFSYSLKNDPTLYPALLASVSVIDLLGNPAPLPKKSIWMKPFSWTMYFFTLLMVLYALESVYRCAYFLSGTLLLLCFLQLV